MRRIKDKYMIRCKGSEGSSLAIALFFFLLCSLMCAGILFLANSSGRGVSKSLANAPVFEKPSTPPAGTIQPGMTNEELAVQIVYNELNDDFSTIFTNLDNKKNTEISEEDNFLTYSIFYDLLYSNGGSTRSYTVNLGDPGLPDVTVTVSVEGFSKSNGSSNQSFDFKSFSITVSSRDSSRDSEMSFKYEEKSTYHAYFSDDFEIGKNGWST